MGDSESLYETVWAQVAGGLDRLRRTKFARDAAWLLVFNLSSRAAAFFGNAYRARCLGPYNLGISSLVQVTQQQAALVYNAGFDTVAARTIAADPKSCREVTETVLTSRLCLAAVVAAIWAICTLLFIGASHRMAWLMGIPLLFTTSGTLIFAFQGLEKLPIQTAITAGGTFLSASAYFVFFKPGMFLGSDLIVISAAAVAVAVASWAAYFHLFGRLPLAKVSWASVQSLVQQSWRYWLLAVFVYFYYYFQIPLVAWIRGAREAGIFRSAFLLAAGLELMYTSISNLLLPRLVIWQQQGLEVMWRKQAKLSLILLGIGVPTTAAAILAAPFVYRVLFGKAYEGGTVVFQILAVGRLVVFVGQIYAFGLAATKQDTQYLLGTLYGAISSVTLTILLIPKYGIVGAACVSLLADIIIHGYYFSVQLSRVQPVGWLGNR
jgi:O-antigen/teichoic acid export membrane protein